MCNSIENRNICERLNQILLPEGLTICCLYLLDVFGFDFNSLLKSLSLPSNSHEDLVKIENLNDTLLSDDFLVLYNKKKEYLDENFGLLKANLKKLSIINYATLAGTKSSNNELIDYTKQIMIVDKHFSMFDAKNIDDIDKNIISDFINLIFNFLECGIVQFGFKDTTKENINIYNKGTFSPILVFGRYSKILYTERDEERSSIDTKIFWINAEDFIYLIVNYYSGKSGKFYEYLNNVKEIIATNETHICFPNIEIMREYFNYLIKYTSNNGG